MIQSLFKQNTQVQKWDIWNVHSQTQQILNIQKYQLCIPYLAEASIFLIRPTYLRIQIKCPKNMHECAHIFHSSCLQILPKSILSTLLLFYRFWLVCCCSLRRWLSYMRIFLSLFIHVISNIFLLVLFIRQICDYYLLWWFCCSLTINFWCKYILWTWYIYRYMPIYEMILICLKKFFFNILNIVTIYTTKVYDVQIKNTYMCFGESIFLILLSIYFR